MKKIQQDFPSRECGSQGKRYALRGLVSWSDLDDRCIRIHRFSVRMGRRRAFHRHISNNCERMFINKFFERTIFRFLVAGKGLGASEIDTNTNLQFKHAFPRCNGESWREVGLDLCKLMVGRFVQIFERALKSSKPWSP